MYRPNRTFDYQFLDRNIREQYQVGGVDIYVHRYLGPQTGDPGNADATLPVYDTQNPLFIEDLLLLENRDRVYDPNVYIMRGVYRTQDVDFDLTQFGLFLNNDTLFITFHYNDMIDTFGRKLMNGDVFEVPNLKDYHPLNTSLNHALPRYYVIQDAAFAQEGFSQTWLPHLWRVKATPMVDSQEFNSITKQPFEPDNIWDDGNFYPMGFTVLDGATYYVSIQNVPAGTAITNVSYWTQKIPATIATQMSTKPRELEINDAILVQAGVEVPLSGYDTVKFFILPTSPDGAPIAYTRWDTGSAYSYGSVVEWGKQFYTAKTTVPSNTPTTDSDFWAPYGEYTAGGQSASAGLTVDGTNTTVDGTQGGQGTSPRGDGYTMGYLTGDDIAPNGLPVTPGVSFPPNPTVGDYSLRLDYFPNRLFRYNGASWIKIEDKVRTGLDLDTSALTQRASFVNNTATVQTTDRGPIPSRQSLSQILKPNADNGG